MKIVNLTGHPIRLGYSAEMLESSGRARVRGDYNEVGVVYVEGPPEAHLPILEITEQRISNLPRPKEGVLYVVSGIVSAKAQRDDVVAPGRTERVGGGRVVALHAFTRPKTGE